MIIIVASTMTTLPRICPKFILGSKVEEVVWPIVLLVKARKLRLVVLF